MGCRRAKQSFEMELLKDGILSTQKPTMSDQVSASSCTCCIRLQPSDQPLLLDSFSHARWSLK